MTKNLAIRLVREQKMLLNCYITFSSKNRGADTFWANPPLDVLGEDWGLILNDTEQQKLYVFFIPADTISHRDILVRSDKPDLIDLQIAYGDSTYTDNRSKVSFSRFFEGSISY